MEQRRRRHTPADSLPADESAAEPLADGAAGGEHAAASAAEPAAAASASDQRQEDGSLALIGQELVPLVGNGLETGEKCEKEPEGPSNEGAFQTPADKKPASTPSDQLQLQNTPWNGKNDDSENKGRFKGG